MRPTTITTLLLITAALGACGAPAAGGPITVGGGGERAAAGGEGGGTEVAVPFTSTRFGYRVSAPAPMTEAADGTASTGPGAERLVVRVLTSAQAEPLALARSELDALRAKTAGFAVRAQPAQVSIAGRGVIRAVYASTDGTNAVTGKPNPFTTAVYWIAKDRSTVAILAYTTQTSQFDPQGADDVEATFAWR